MSRWTNYICSEPRNRCSTVPAVLSMNTRFCGANSIEDCNVCAISKTNISSDPFTEAFSTPTWAKSLQLGSVNKK